MKSFKFRLQTVLEQRERQETAAKQNFAEADLAWRRAETLLGELNEIRAALLCELNNLRCQGFDAAETRVYQEYMQTITSSIKDQEAHVRDAMTTREAFKLHMVGATQGRQVIDKVKTRDKDEHHRERERASQKAMDDLVSTRYVAAQRAQEQTT